MALENFSLEAAQKGKELVTRSGKPVRYITVLGGNNPPSYPLLVEVFYNPGETEWSKHRWTMENYAITGQYLPPLEHPLDLFIKTL